MQPRRDLAAEVTCLDPRKARFFVDAFEDLNLELGGGRIYSRVRVKRAFPLTCKDCFIVVQDREGQEIGSLARLDSLDPASRQAVEEELERAYFTPRIQRITRVTTAYRVPRWEVETDRGPRAFEIYSSRRDGPRAGRRQGAGAGRRRQPLRDPRLPAPGPGQPCSCRGNAVRDRPGALEWMADGPTTHWQPSNRLHADSPARRRRRGRRLPARQTIVYGGFR